MDTSNVSLHNVFLVVMQLLQLIHSCVTMYVRELLTRTYKPLIIPSVNYTTHPYRWLSNHKLDFAIGQK